jgi:hypothetical protein
MPTSMALYPPNCWKDLFMACPLWTIPLMEAEENGLELP